MANEQKQVLLPQKGERAFIVGQTGSGKTAFACWILRRLPDAPIIIYDTKEEPKFLTLPKSNIATSIESVEQLIDAGESDFIIFRPALHIVNDPGAMDDLLLFHYNNFREVTAYLDETYQFHNNGRSGNGLVGLITRGRSRGITTIMSTQRPTWISTFVMSEAQKIYAFKLTKKTDKKKLADVIPDFEQAADPPKHGFWYFETGGDMETPIKYGPVTLDKSMNLGYIDEPTISDDEEAETEPSKHVWI